MNNLDQLAPVGLSVSQRNLQLNDIMSTIKLPLHKEDIVLMLSVLGRKFETREQAEDYAKAMQIEHPS